MLTAHDRRKVLELRHLVAEHFDGNDWLEFGTLLGEHDRINRHPRLLRSLSFNDPDYAGAALQVLMGIAEADADNLAAMEAFVTTKYGGGGETVSSTRNDGPRIYFQPSVFKVPKDEQDPRLVSVMMPFAAEFTSVYDAIQEACARCGMGWQRADNIWKESVVIQDVFGLIYRSYIVVCDFTGKNPNVFYEAGIAHTLGKHVIPITQSVDDIPFDLRHHRALPYLKNAEGLAELIQRLAERIHHLDRNREV